MFNKNPQTNTKIAASPVAQQVIVGSSAPPSWLSRLGAILLRRKLLVLAGVAAVVIGIGVYVVIGLMVPANQTSPSGNDTATVTEPTGPELVGEPAPTEEPKAEETKPAAQKPQPTASGGSTDGGGSTGGGNTGGGGSTPTSCALPNYPDATCTGVPTGVSLTASSGDLHITEAGSIVEGKNITGCVYVEANNVTIKNTKVNCDWAFAIRNFGYTGLLIEDVEVSCIDTTATGLAGNNFTARRLNVHGCENGFSIQSNVLIEDSYIHTLIHGVDGHTDGIQINDGSSDITIRHNKIFNQDTGGTSAIIGDTGTHTNILIENNLLAGGAYTLYCAITPTNYRVLNNHFSREFYPNSGNYGPWVYCDGSVTATGNIWHDTGLPVSF